MKSISKHKFNKKYNLLESKLLKFLYWREQNAFTPTKIASKGSLISTSTLNQEVILMKKIVSLTPEGNLNQISLNFKTVNLFELLNEMCLPKNIFPEKAPFLKYWLIPFVSLSLLISKKFSSSQVLSSPTITTLSSNSSLKEGITALPAVDSSFSDINSLYQVIFEDEKLKRQYQHLLNNEQNELSTLAKYYYQKLNKNLNKNTKENFFQNKNKDYVQSNSSILFPDILKRESYQSAKILWNWLTLHKSITSLNSYNHKNDILNTWNQEWNFPTSQLLAFQTIPSKLEPSIFQTFLNDTTFNNLQIGESTQLTPIESYKNAQILLDQLTTNIMGSTDLFSPIQYSWTKLTSRLSSPLEKTQLISIIDKLCISPKVNNEIMYLSFIPKISSSLTTNEAVPSQIFKNQRRNLKNSFLKIYLNKFLKTKHSLKFLESSNFSNIILHHQILLKLQNKKEFYARLTSSHFLNNIDKNLFNLTFKKFKSKNANVSSQFQNHKKIVEYDQIYTHFYFNHYMNLLNQIQQYQNLIQHSLEKKNSKITQLTYKLFLLQKLKNFLNFPDNSKKEDIGQFQKKHQFLPKRSFRETNGTKSETRLTPLDELHPSNVSLGELTEIYNNLDGKSNSIVKLKMPFKSISFLLNSDSIANKQEIQKQESKHLEIFSKQNRILNQHPQMILSKDHRWKRQKNSVSKTETPWKTFLLFNQLNNPVFKMNFSLFLTEIIVRFGSFKTILDCFATSEHTFLEKNAKELIWNSALSSVPSDFRARIQKKPSQFAKLEMHSTKDRRKMEKVLKNYLSSKIYVPNSLTNLQSIKSQQNNPELFQKKKAFLNLLKKLKIRVHSFESPTQKLQKEKISQINQLIVSNLNQKPKPEWQQNQLNPNSLIKRIGFVFIRKMDPPLNLENQKKNSKTIESSLLNQIEERKAQQKKQRRKKQNLETRRRKKRKRWYPRPHWLRFQMYQHFLQLRHFPKKYKNFQPRLATNLTNHFAFLGTQFPKFSNSQNLIHESKFQIYRKTQQHWGHLECDKPKFDRATFQKLTLIKSLPIFMNQDFYKISNTTMNDFQRLCWKSSWLRSNLNPYISRIQQNLKKMKESQQVFEAKSTFQLFLSSFFGFKKSDLALGAFHSFSQQNLDKPSSIDNTKLADVSLDWYFNYNTCFEPKTSIPSFSMFQNQENIENYNFILMKRISTIIKNVKMNLNTNGQPQAHSFVQGHRQLEKRNQPSQMDEFLYNITSTSFPVQAITIPFSPLNYISDLDFGVSRLRMLWALNRTHGLTFKENTDIQKIWQSGKVRDQNKSNKTKKFVQKSINQLFPKNLKKLSFQKIKTVEKKLGWHRTNEHFSKRIFDILPLSLNNIQSDSQKSKLHFKSFRDFKFYLKAKSIPTFSNSHLLETTNMNLSTLPRFQIEKAQKNEFHFWWSMKTPFESFFPMCSRGIDTFESYNESSANLTSWSIFLIVNSLWLCAILFHLSILFSLFRIGEIRSLFKFYFLMFSKISQGYLILLKMTWVFLETYSVRIHTLFMNIAKQIVKVNQTNFQLTEPNLQKPIWVISSNVDQNSAQFQLTKLDQTSLVEQVWVRLPFVSLHFVQLPSPSEYSFKIRSNHLLTASVSGDFPSNTWRSQEASKRGQISNKLFLFDELASLIQFPLLLTLKSVFLFMDSSLTICYKVLYKIIDFFESCVMVIYHFLEKPAELMIEWIAQVFFIEWTSDILSFFPDLFDSQIWNAFSKFSRGSRIAPILGLLVQRRLFCVAETLVQTLAKPDIDLLERQKKGILFWDIWGEILIQAAENYQMNLVSFMTLKDEQDLFMEKLLEDSKWEWSYQSMIKMSPLFHFIGISASDSGKGSERTQFRQLTTNFLTNNSKFPSTSTNFVFNTFEQSNFSVSRRALPIHKESQFLSQRFLEFMNSLNFQSKILSRSVTQSASLRGSNDHWKRWSVNQSFTYQGRDTELFVDLHPPKSFHHLSFLKSTPIAQQTLGPLVCQIYSGLFTNEIAKNILLVGSPGIAKTLFIQGLAGETELKLMTDHAQRYAGVQQGIAVGMKFLKDVFDAIALYSPCIFLLEDIHLIGEKRSMLISDQENNVNNEEIFGVHQEEIHEKNQLFYHWTRHHLAHYQRPYKSDFSVGIPTNQFCFDLFFGVQPPKTRSFIPKTPLPLSNIERQIMNQNGNPLEQSIESVDKMFQSQQKTITVSYLQMHSEKTLSPPATSPFFIFALKEKQHLKPRKRVKQIPWGGFSSDQMNLLPKMAYSVRIKVALLADLAIRNLSVKLDMITDLLVILDNVRSNRGFVVFATTHMPSLLDPALRRPGRFDETISLPLYPNLLNRWEILKTNLSEFSTTCDFLDYAMVTSHFNETTLLQLISETKLSLFNLTDPFQPSSNIFPISSLNQAFQAIIEKPILLPKMKSSPLTNSLNWKAHSHLTLHPAVLMSLTYFQIGTLFVRQNLLKTQNSYHYATWTQLHQLEKPEEFLFKQFYSPSYELKNQVTQFFSGKIAQSLILHSSSPTNSLPVKDFKSSKNMMTRFKPGSKNQKFAAIGGFELFWNSATAFVSALIYKRFLYQTNIVTSSLFHFDNSSLLLKPLSPPASTIAMPAKKYENFQRIHRDFHQKMHLSIHNKLEMHEKQRFMKNLYKKPIENCFRSESLAAGRRRGSPFSNSFQELGYLDSIMLKPTSVNAYYQSRMLTRHKFSLIHQWWNGQLAEHNMESTFLSDVDWRSMFVRSIGDLVIDFPDAEQYYNPRQRRWFCNSSSWGYWLHFNQTLSHEISYHFMLHCYQNASNHLQQHRESLDYYAHTMIQQSMLKEIDFITVSSRFQIQ